MKQLELSIEKEIDFMLKYNLTADELFLIKLIFYAQEGKSELLQKFFNSNHLTLGIRELLFNLQDKGIINDSYRIPKSGEEWEPENTQLNKNVVKCLLQHSTTMGMELFNKYPATITIDGRIYSLRNITKLYKSFDEFCYSYGKEIKFSEEKHKEIMELLDEAIENNWIKSGICDFVASHQWTTIQELKDKGAEIYDNNEAI